MGAADDFERYTNERGLVSRAPGASTGNDLLYSCLAEIVKAKNWAPLETGKLLGAIRKHAEILPGLYKRPGWEQDQTALDDYIGLIAWSSEHCPVIAEEVWAYGKRAEFPIQYYYPTTGQKHFDIHAWLGRSPSFVAHVDWGAGETPSWFHRLAWAVAVAFSGSMHSQDEWVLSWCLIQVAGNKSWLERLATRIYYRRLYKNFPRGLKDVFAIYFKDPEHPLSKWWKP